MSSSSDLGEANSPQTEHKRKRHAAANEEDIEIDLKLPEPPSKKAKRQQKKNEKRTGVSTNDTAVKIEKEPAVVRPSEEQQDEIFAKRSEYSIWIGNLMWTTNKDDLRQFFNAKGGIQADHITRVHMPAPPAKGPTWKGPKPVNKGFAYVDFLEESEMQTAIEMSEELLGGRKVLIKNAKSFEGRPQAKPDGTSAVKSTSQKAPSKRIFVGGLPFEITKDELQEHFSQAGEVEEAFIATFEDTGKCKGFGFIRFTSIDAAQAAVNGFIHKERAELDEDEDDAQGHDEPAGAEESKRSLKKRKWYINRLHGQTLRCEFAEDAQSRYKKRFGKEAKSDRLPGNRTSEASVTEVSDTTRPSRRADADQRQAQRRKKHEDARLIAPGRALANAKRATGAIVSATGTKTTFE